MFGVATLGKGTDRASGTPRSFTFKALMHFLFKWEASWPGADFPGPLSQLLSCKVALQVFIAEGTGWLSEGASPLGHSLTLIGNCPPLEGEGSG